MPLRQIGAPYLQPDNWARVRRLNEEDFSQYLALHASIRNQDQNGRVREGAAAKDAKDQRQERSENIHIFHERREICG